MNRNIASVEGDCKKFVKETLEPFAKQTILPAFKKMKTELDASLGDKSPKFQEMINNFEKEVNAELAKPENKESLDATLPINVSHVLNTLGSFVWKNLKVETNASAASIDDFV